MPVMDTSRHFKNPNGFSCVHSPLISITEGTSSASQVVCYPSTVLTVTTFLNFEFRVCGFVFNIVNNCVWDWWHQDSPFFKDARTGQK